ncbi:signal transduction histidine kinase [Hamadaea flava]|uniref:histidine kinase n=1 Tax=Hamadaea flava TaxID=1742688 RepID=A0ABV8M251_9ACTN|nr:nitrate- and nitrite sensing domain-containing protein [Hamadaea flava]MCP2326921.1 signal transduction histidine kinase [Hamadaea flava]
MNRPLFLRRTWTIRSRVLLLLLAPLLPLVGMWAFSTTLSVSAAGNLLDAETSANNAALPTGAVAYSLERERKLSSQLVSGDTGVAGALKDQRSGTDSTVAKLKQFAEGEDLRDSASPAAMRRIDEMLTALGSLPTARASVDTGRYSRLQVVNAYTAMIEKAFAVFSTAIEVDDHTLAQASTTTATINEARDLFSLEDALISGVLAGGGTYAPGERSMIVQAIGAQRHLYIIGTRSLLAEDTAWYEKITTSEAYTRVRAAEDKISESTGTRVPGGIDRKQWDADITALNLELSHLEDQIAGRAIEAATPAATRIILRLLIAGLLGLLLIIGLVLLSIRIARSIIRRLRELRAEALDMADRKLPDVVGRLRRGEAVDVDAEAPPLSHADDELGQLGGAFAEMQRTAIEAAVHEAHLRAGLNQVFLNLGRRSQVLVHRQLSLLDAMERRVTDPQDLEELYRIDHLGTRLRRHSEDLVILAGAVPGRGWRNPVPLHDVLRSAVSEVEEYTRITVVTLPEMALIGRAVSDVVHLLAELLENATAFSPRDTHVQLSGQLVPNGFAVEIEDRGVGLPQEAIDEANGRLAEPPDFDPAHSSRLGLFVVARLAARHGIKVTLRASPYGGITAVALLPRELVVEERPAQGELTVARPQVALAALPAGDTPKAATAVAADRTPALHPSGSSLPAPPALMDEATAEQPMIAALAGEPLGPAARSAVQPVSGPHQLSPEGLPMRQRQASLAPQLRVQNGEEEQPVRTSRAPEASRSMLSSLQAGTNRGRAEAAQQAAPPLEGSEEQQ